MKAKIIVDFEIHGHLTDPKDIANMVEVMLQTGNHVCVNQYYRLTLDKQSISVQEIMTDEEFAKELMKE